jgi:exopolyphosphatase/guanosine-5'-triphosphate,3'-diphosphate pyrophosphatase
MPHMISSYRAPAGGQAFCGISRVMPRYAAIDIGSNSVRMLVAEATGSGIRSLAADRSVTRLGESVFRSGRISEDAIRFLCDQLVRMREVYSRLDVQGVRALATAAVRDASNQHEVLDRASQAIGARVEIISGQEEARLIHMGVQSRWPQKNGRVLMVDVGGGSMELILSEAGELKTAFSKPLGAVRLTEVFLKSDPPDARALGRMDKYIDEKLAAPLRRIGHGPFQRMIGTSATAAAIVSAVNRVPRARRDTADRLRATAAQVRRLFNELSVRDLAGRRKLAGIGPRRAEIIVAGAAVFRRVLDAFQQSSMYYLAAGVRDGIIVDLAARRVGRELSRLNREQRAVVEDMARRYGVELKHARRVAVLAHEMFDGLRPLHRLPPEQGKLLEASAYLHDIGHFISDTGHHKHSAYIVAHADMPGFTDAERHVIAMLCRFHRKTMPQARHSGFQALAPDWKRSILYLSPLLRLADSLDRGHEQRVEDVECQLKNGTVVLALKAHADADLEQWAAEGAADIFRQVYQTPLTVVRVRSTMTL